MSQSGIAVMKSAASPEDTRCSAHASRPWQPRKSNAPATPAVSHCRREAGTSVPRQAEPGEQHGRTAGAAEDHGHERWHVRHGVADGEEGPAPHQVDGREGADDPGP